MSGIPESARYHGRFAPSPSGLLHLGSVVTAVASFLDARASGGRWSLRIEDLDRQRERPGAGDAILRELERLGLGWDGPVLRQHTRLAAYREAVASLGRTGAVFACACSRRDSGGGPYPGTCRTRELPWQDGFALRLSVPDRVLQVSDRLQGTYRQHLALDCGDFVLWRADGEPAYHLAVVVDDAWQGITDIVRGADLLDSTPRQVHLQHCLGLPQPRYAHVPLVLDADGRKLSKQTLATAVSTTSASQVLSGALDFLGLSVPATLRAAPPAEILGWAKMTWSLATVSTSSRRFSLSADTAPG